MSFSNQYVLRVDIKKRLSSVVPTFKQGDNGVLKFQIFDDGKKYDLTDYTYSEVTFRLPSGQSVVGNPILDVSGELTYNFTGVEMSEVGKIETVLSIYSGSQMVSIQPFTCFIFDSMKGEDLSYIGILQDLIAEVQILRTEVTEAVSELNSTLDEVDRIKDEVTDLNIVVTSQEQIRESNEVQRISNEAVRISNESNRQSSEQSRIQNEQTRNTNEQTRQQSLNDMNTIINQYKFTGSYNSNVTYKKFNQVEFEGSTYIAIADNINAPVSNTNVWRLLASKGAKGDKGDTGAALSILGKLTDESQLPTTGHAGDAYTVNGELYVWSEATGEWENVGNIKGEKGDKGDTGEDGESAYEVAVDNGFVGTSEEWLASLKGEKGDTPDLTGINQKVDGLQTEVTAHLADFETHEIRIASSTRLGHLKVDGITLTVDENGVASATSKGGVYQHGTTALPDSNAFGTSTVATRLKSLSSISNMNIENKTFKITNPDSFVVGDIVNLHDIYQGIAGTAKITSLVSGIATVETNIELKTGMQYISIFNNEDTSLLGSTALGIATFSTGLASFSSGIRSVASGVNSHAFGSGVEATGNSAFVAGTGSVATGMASVALGSGAMASGKYSFAAGGRCIAEGESSTALGENTKARALYSHTQNFSTIANVYGSTAIGVHNKELTGSATAYTATGDAFVIGNQSDLVSSGTNAFRVTFGGKVYGIGAFNSAGADYAEYFEWADGNPDGEDRVGFLVTLDCDKIRKANKDDDYILGIISATASVVGDSHQDHWNNMYLTDDFGRAQYEWKDVDYVDDGEIKIRRDYVPVYNPDYNYSEEYVPREERKEWDAVGHLGKLYVYDDGTCEVNGFATNADNGKATASSKRTKYRVIERVKDNLIRVFVM